MTTIHTTVDSQTSSLTLHGRFAEICHQQPDRLAIIEGNTQLTFAEIAVRVDNLAQRLLANGIGRGDVVAVQLPNGWPFLVAHLAIAKIGALISTIHLPYRGPEVLKFLQTVQAKGMIYPERIGTTDYANDLHAIWPHAPHVVTKLVVGEPTADDEQRFSDWCLQPPTERYEYPVVTADDPIGLFFTSGTTSPVAKTCLHVHRSLIENAIELAADAGMSAQDVFLSASAYTHMFGLLCLHIAVVTGSTIVALEQVTAQQMLEQCTEQQVTVLFAVPTHLFDLLHYGHQHGFGNVSIREVRSAGAHIPPELVRDLRDSLNAAVVNHWGMTELGAGTCTHHLDDETIALRSIGQPVRGARVAVRDEEGFLTTEPHVLGELLFHGPSLFSGYLNNEEANHAAFWEADGVTWFCTGDLAMLDEAGRVMFRGRKKDIINRGGMKISVFEIEAVLRGMPGIAQLALVPVPDERLGEIGCLCVIPDGTVTLTLDAVREFLHANGVTKFKWPERLEILQAFPLTKVGKLAKDQLIAQLARPTGTEFDQGGMHTCTN